MSEPERKGSPWPWVTVPVAAVTLFFVLRACQGRLPPSATVTPVDAPAHVVAPAPADLAPAGTTPAPEPTPTPTP